MLDSKALTKIQSIILIAVIVVAALGGVTAYFLLNEQEQTSETIKIGVLTDLDMDGSHLLRGTELAAEQLNAEGGILGRQVEVIGEDTVVIGQGLDPVEVNEALTRLLTYHKVDFIIGSATDDVTFMIQDTIAIHKTILFSTAAASDANTQRVLDNYDKYKYYFQGSINSSSISNQSPISQMNYKDITGFNKIGYLAVDMGWTKGVRAGLDVTLPKNGFDLVYKGVYPQGTIDFSSYFAAAEAAGVETLIALIGGRNGIAFVKEYYDRQSPMVIVPGAISAISVSDGWEVTDGKCEHICVRMYAIVAGYPLTSKTLPARQAYIDRWDEVPNTSSGLGYDLLRFILPDAIERAGTIETDAVIEALEQCVVETTNARKFQFTESHGVMIKDFAFESSDDMVAIHFQWQNGKPVPIIPTTLREEAGATLTFPDWLGPWDNP